MISCSHSIDGYDRILRYKQPKNQQPIFLGYMYKNNKNPESGVDVEMELGGNADKGKTSMLTIKELNQSSSALYFCAARYHSAAHHCSSVQKPQHTVFTCVFQLTALFLSLGGSLSLLRH